MSDKPQAVASVPVPNLVGLQVGDARALGHDSGVVVTSADPDGPSLGALSWPGRWLVDGQNPRPGTHVARWSTVRITFHKERGGEAGVREPRLPSPDPGHLSAERSFEP